MDTRPPCVHLLAPILPCSDLDISETFYSLLGFTREGGDDNYRILSDGKGGELHLTATTEGWLVPGRNPFGLYLYAENVDDLALVLRDLLLHAPEHKSWGMYEFAVSDPDETLIRIGWPSVLQSGPSLSPKK